MGRQPTRGAGGTWVPPSNWGTNPPMMPSDGPQRSKSPRQIPRSRVAAPRAAATQQAEEPRSVAPHDLDLGGVERIATLEAGEQDHSLDVRGQKCASPAQGAGFPGGAQLFA